MITVQAPVDQLTAQVNSSCHIAERIDFAVLNSLGIFILKSAFDAPLVEKYRNEYFSDIKRENLKKTAFHVTEVKVSQDHFLTQIVREPAFLAFASSFFGGKVGSDFIRIVKKDASNRGVVFMHQDSCYQIGSLNRYSVFIALTPCGPLNGGLMLYPGTHHFGYLGDAGEIRDILPPNYPIVAPDLAPGDLIVMNSAIWHKSPENVDGTDRVYLEVHLQHIDEPNTRIAICGERTSKWSLLLKEDDIFVNSRAQRLRHFLEKLKAYETVS